MCLSLSVPECRLHLSDVVGVTLAVVLGRNALGQNRVAFPVIKDLLGVWNFKESFFSKAYKACFSYAFLVYSTGDWNVISMTLQVVSSVTFDTHTGYLANMSSALRTST